MKTTTPPNMNKDGTCDWCFNPATEIDEVMDEYLCKSCFTQEYGVSDCNQ